MSAKAKKNQKQRDAAHFIERNVRRVRENRSQQRPAEKRPQRRVERRFDQTRARFNEQANDPRQHSQNPGGLRRCNRMRRGQRHQREKNKSDSFEPGGEFIFLFDLGDFINPPEKLLHR